MICRFSPYPLADTSLVPFCAQLYCGAGTKGTPVWSEFTTNSGGTSYMSTKNSQRVTTRSNEQALAVCHQAKSTNCTSSLMPCLSLFRAPLAPADAPVLQAAAATADLAGGCATHTSTTPGCPGRFKRRAPRWGSHAGRAVGVRFVAVAPSKCAAAAPTGGAGGEGEGSAPTPPGTAMAPVAADAAMAVAAAGAVPAKCVVAAISVVADGTVTVMTGAV